MNQDPFQPGSMRMGSVRPLRHFFGTHKGGSGWAATFCTFQEIDQTQVAVVGGKGANLGGLRRSTASAFRPGFLRDDGRLPAQHGGSAVARRAERAAGVPEAGRPGGDPRAQRGDPTDHRRIAIPDDLAAAIARSPDSGRASRLRRPIQRHGGGLARASIAGRQDTYPERRRAGSDPPAHQPVQGLAVSPSGP